MTTQTGKCRCGTFIHFQLGPHGYKARCPKCGAGVRLRVDALPTTEYKPVDGIAEADLEPLAGPSASPNNPHWPMVVLVGTVLALACITGALFYISGH